MLDVLNFLSGFQFSKMEDAKSLGAMLSEAEAVLCELPTILTSCHIALF
jgi:hypothetical protein